MWKEGKIEVRIRGKKKMNERKKENERKEERKSEN